MKIREVIKRLEDEGWTILRQKGGHRQYRKPGNPNVVTVAGKPSNDVKPGIYSSIAQKAGWK
ncbi:MAG: type II toxin-antitoxin system HicA family toxin [Chloroflexota bacterium]|nr:type II toxin-antitoxin system HicA family toxin [Chloroflexota bacterium]